MRDDNQVEVALQEKRCFAVRTFDTVLTSDWDTIDCAYPTNTTEIYTYKYQGNVVSVVTLTYSDDTKEQLTQVVRS